MEDHWFDTLNKALVRDVSRRMALGSLTSLIASSLALSVGTAAKKRKRRKRKEKDKKNKRKDGDKGNQPPPIDWSLTCSFGSCFKRWPSRSPHDRDSRNYCEFICEQCRVDPPRAFCIKNDEVADCCEVGETCCDGNRCVQLGTPEHCTGCDEPCQEAGKECCSGYCIDILSNERDCGGCGQLCLHPDKRCCDGSCVDIKFDDAHCGGCNPCPPGWECCHGRCIDKAKAWCCYDHHPSVGICPISAPCCINSLGNESCCLLP